MFEQARQTLETAARRRTVRRQLRELQHMDDHLIKDMGLSRHQIAEAIRNA